MTRLTSVMATHASILLIVLLLFSCCAQRSFGAAPVPQQPATAAAIKQWRHPDYPLSSPGGKSQKKLPNMPRYYEYVHKSPRASGSRSLRSNVIQSSP